MHIKYDWELNELNKKLKSEFDDNIGKYIIKGDKVEIHIDSWNNKVHIMNPYNQFFELSIEDYKILSQLFKYDVEFDEFDDIITE